MSIKSSKKEEKISDYQRTENTSPRHHHHNQNYLLQSPRLLLPARFSLLLPRRPPCSPPLLKCTLIR